MYSTYSWVDCSGLPLCRPQQSCWLKFATTLASHVHLQSFGCASAYCDCTSGCALSRFAWEVVRIARRSFPLDVRNVQCPSKKTSSTLQKVGGHLVQVGNGSLFPGVNASTTHGKLHVPPTSRTLVQCISSTMHHSDVD
jgi:hypothetical protein